MTSASNRHIFGTLSEPHTVIIARGERIRHFTVTPWVFGLSSVLASTLVVGYLAATGYFVMRDDIVASGGARQARLQQAYEDRIASLRTELDRVVSRQMLDRQTVGTKVDTLIDQQAELAARYEKLSPLFDRARTSGLLAASVPLPSPSPREVDPLTADAGDSLALSYNASTPAAADRFAGFDKGLFGTLRTETNEAAEDKAQSEFLHEIGKSLETAEDRQIAGLSSLAESARARASGIASVLRDEGIGVPAQPAEAPSAAGGEGGPFVAVPEDQMFAASYADLDTALDRLQALVASTRQLPLGTPVAGAPVSSTFGVRTDPFLGRSAMHTGIDFVAVTGTNAGATAAGTVVFAGESGGYGNMVEVDHGGGVSTRYGHLSAITVSVGDHVAAGDTIGRVGSTGRSTGPHLHYEVRREGAAIDPARFLRAGRRIHALG